MEVSIKDHFKPSLCFLAANGLKALACCVKTGLLYKHNCPLSSLINVSVRFSELCVLGVINRVTFSLQSPSQAPHFFLIIEVFLIFERTVFSWDATHCKEEK